MKLPRRSFEPYSRDHRGLNCLKRDVAELLNLLKPCGPLKAVPGTPYPFCAGLERTRNQPVRPIWADHMHVAQGGYVMRTFDLAPLYRSTVGFDRLISLVDQLAGHNGNASGYPPYNIERTGEDAYRISVAVAGF